MEHLVVSSYHMIFNFLLFFEFVKPVRVPYTLPPAHLFRLGQVHIVKIAVALSGVSHIVTKKI